MSNSILVSYPGPDPLGGVICTSGLIAFTPENFNTTAVAFKAQRETPYLAYHGLIDPTVPFPIANLTYSYYYDNLYKDLTTSQFEIHTDANLVHTWDQNEQNYITKWIASRIDLI